MELAHSVLQMVKKINTVVSAYSLYKVIIPTTDRCDISKHSASRCCNITPVEGNLSSRIFTSISLHSRLEFVFNITYVILI